MAEKTSGLVGQLKRIPDPRRQCKNLWHKLEDILVMAFCGVLAGCDDFVEIATWASYHEDFFRTFMELPNGIPSHDTFGRVCAMVRSETLQGVLLPWLHQRRGNPGELVHIDGKYMRRTRHNSKNLGALDVVSAWASQAGLTLGQVAVETKSNEITAIPHLLELLDLQEKIVTIDAAGCQKDIAAAIVAGGGDYVLAVKDNQPTLHAEIQAAFAEVETEPLPRRREYATEEKGHGRLEQRTVRVLPVGKHLSQKAAWAGVLSLVMVVRVVMCTSTGVVSREVGYYLSSLRPDARRIGGAIRGHWTIENGLHWVLDVVFREDARRIYDRVAAQNIAFMNRLALSILRGDPAKASLKVKRKHAGWDIHYLAQLLGF
ncbi:MAG TPA: ISAs1 family transposase [Candidatus Acidoferrum sp.]|nr:ISAs1 family transposase [Candidatus Acidoferrum sp.]